MKLTIICDVSHVISYTRPSSPLFFSGGIEKFGISASSTIILLMVLQVRDMILNLKLGDRGGQGKEGGGRGRGERGEGGGVVERKAWK